MKRSFSFFVFCTLFSPELEAQRLYNEGQDQRAREAVTASVLLRDSSVFDKALANLSEVQKLQQENILLGARLQTRADVNSWHDWESVSATVERVRREIHVESDATSDEWKKALGSIAQNQAELNKSLNALKDKVAASNPQGGINAIGEWLDRIGRLKPIADYLLKMAENGTPSEADLRAANQVNTALAGLTTLYKSFVIEIPEKPSVIYLVFKLQLLEADEQHYKNLIAIRLRRDEETVGIRLLSNRVIRAITQLKLNGSVTDSLRAQAKLAGTGTDEEKAQRRNDLDIMLTALMDAAATAARGHLPSDLAAQRESLEIRAHSLRRSRLAASVYEQLIANGAQRLSAYYKGGIRPRTLAELLHALATAGVIPSILVSK